MKYASGYHRLKAKYEALQNDFNFKSEVVNTLIDENDEKARKIDDLQIAKSHLQILNDLLERKIKFLNDSIKDREEMIKAIEKDTQPQKQLIEAQSKLIKALAFGWVVFIAAFLIFLFTF